MWPPPNIQSLPSKKGIQRIKEEITSIELEILHAPLKTAALQKSLIERNVWIAPIRTTPHEILSQIVIQTSRNDWKAPLVLQGVSRRWRDVVIDSPEAWTFVPLSACSWAGQFELMSLFLERSRNTPLHEYVNGNSLLRCMEALESRVKCVHIDVQRFLLEDYLQRGRRFDQLKTLRIETWREHPTGETQPTVAWDMLLFPNLTVLDIDYPPLSLLRAISAAPEFPAIRHLTITSNDPRWGPADILTKCAKSVESVELTYVTGNSAGLDAENEIHFPRLRYLRLVDLSRQEGSRFRLNANTPALQAHFDHGNVSIMDIVSVDTGNVTVLHTLRTPDLSRYPRLITLCFDGRTDRDAELGKLIEWLSDDPAICPDLALIEYTGELTSELLGRALSAILTRGKITGQTIRLMTGAFKLRSMCAQTERVRMFRELEQVCFLNVVVTSY